MSESQLTDAQERRQYFRIDDTIRVDIRRLSSDEQTNGLNQLERGEVNNFTLMSSLAAITAQSAVHIHRIENELPDVAAYLKAIDRKLEVVGRGLMTQRTELVAEQAQAVNLSAGGISLEVAEVYAAHCSVEVRMLLFPSFTGVQTYGEVVDCRAVKRGSDTRYRVRVEFQQISEQDRDILIRHILRRQGEELRARQQGSE